jgi:hypothetical protein
VVSIFPWQLSSHSCTRPVLESPLNTTKTLSRFYTHQNTTPFFASSYHRIDYNDADHNAIDQSNRIDGKGTGNEQSGGIWVVGLIPYSGGSSFQARKCRSGGISLESSESSPTTPPKPNRGCVLRQEKKAELNRINPQISLYYAANR